MKTKKKNKRSKARTCISVALMSFSSFFFFFSTSFFFFKKKQNKDEGFSIHLKTANAHGTFYRTQQIQKSKHNTYSTHQAPLVLQT